MDSLWWDYDIYKHQPLVPSIYKMIHYDLRLGGNGDGYIILFPCYFQRNLHYPSQTNESIPLLECLILVRLEEKDSLASFIMKVQGYVYVGHHYFFLHKLVKVDEAIKWQAIMKKEKVIEEEKSTEKAVLAALSLWYLCLRFLGFSLTHLAFSLIQWAPPILYKKINK